MSLTKAWWNRALFGAKSGELRPLRLPGIGAIAFLLLAIISLALPGMRQGLTAVVQTWTASDGKLSQSELYTLGSQAERDHDAKMLAFVVLRLEPKSPDRVRWADLAVALDPKLTWVYFHMAHYQSEFVMADAELATRAARLQKWDPDNAVPYLMQADRLIDDTKWNYSYTDFGGKYDFSDAAVALTKSNPKWASLMDQAFRAPRFDDYSYRKSELTLNVMREHKLDRPLDVIYSVWSTRMPNLFNIHIYAAALQREGAILEAAGDTSASQKYWMAANFAQRMKLGSRGEAIEQMIAMGIIQKSFTRLQALLGKEGRLDEAKYAGYEVQSADLESRTFRASYNGSDWEGNAELWSGVMMHASAALMIVAASLSLISLVWLGATYRNESRSLGRKCLCAIGRYSPAILLFSVVMFYTSYFPYLRAFRSATPDNLHRLSQPFSMMLELPIMFSQSGRNSGAMYFWSAITVVGVSAAAIMLLRMTLRERLAKQAA